MVTAIRVTRAHPEPRDPAVLERAVAALLRRRLNLRPVVQSPARQLTGAASGAVDTSRAPAVPDYAGRLAEGEQR